VALGGRKAARGRRDIDVNGWRYTWRVAGGDRRSMRESKLIVVIGQADHPHQRLTVRGPGLSWTVFAGGQAFSHSNATPRLIRDAILFARASGWPDRRPSLILECDAKGRLSVAAPTSPGS
jgi:hypothetical protein